MSKQRIALSMQLLAAVGAVAAATRLVAQEAMKWPGDKTYSYATFTTEYYLSELDPGGAQPLDAANDAVIITGKPGGTLTPSTTTSDECGKYWNGTSYQNSTVYTGTFQETSVFALSTNDSKSVRVPVSIYFKGTRPNPGKKNTAVAIYREHVTDDGRCVQGGKTYDKYTMTMD